MLPPPLTLEFLQHGEIVRFEVITAFQTLGEPNREIRQMP